MQKNTSSSSLLNPSIKSDCDSAIEKTQPIYQLRLHDSGEYKEGCWIKTPVLLPNVKVDLSPEQCEETFNFFLLSGDRLSQMTRTYHDMDAVMHLLEEKERDLELAARIGQTLLKRNREISDQKDELEEKLEIAIEEASQLRYEVIQKERLLLSYADNEDDDNFENSNSVDNLRALIKTLHYKVQQLENEKVILAKEKSLVESSHLQNNKREENLFSTTVQQLSHLQTDLQSANAQIVTVTSELTKRNKEASKQQDEIETLLSQVNYLQTKHKQLLNDHQDLQSQLFTANKSQLELSQEVQQLESKYIEVLNMLDGTKQEMQHIQASLFTKSHCSLDFDPKWHVPFESSLAAELKATCISDENRINFTYDECNDISTFIQDKNCHSAIAFSANTGLSKADCDALQTVKFVNSSKISSISNLPLSQSLPLSFKQTSVSHKPKWILGHSPPLLESPDLGQPGVPGTTDLQRAIEKLAHVGKESLKFVQQTRHQLLFADQNQPMPKTIKKCVSAPKLRIVKPLEGSVTLSHWKNLADKSTEFPTMLLSPPLNAGVITRGSIAFSKDTLRSSTPKNQLKPYSNVASSNNSTIHQSEIGTSGLLLSSSNAKMPLQFSNTFATNSNVSYKCNNTENVPCLPSLAAALSPSAHSTSIVHAVNSRLTALSISNLSPVNLADLHGSDHHNSFNGGKH